jgi:hypothetical protein
MSVQNTPFYSNSQAVHHESVGNTYKDPNLVEHSLKDMEVNSTPVPITKPESDLHTQGPPIAIKAAQNPIKPSGNVNNLAKENFQHSITSDSATSRIKYERIPRQLTNRKERTRETPVALQALKTMPKTPSADPIRVDSPAVAVPEPAPALKRFVYTPPNKPPAPTLLDAAKAAGSNIAQAPNSPASPQAEEKREYVLRKLPRMPKPNVPQKPISAAPSINSTQNISTSKTQKPLSEATAKSGDMPSTKPGVAKKNAEKEEKNVQKKPPSSKKMSTATASSKPTSPASPAAKKTVQKTAPSATSNVKPSQNKTLVNTKHFSQFNDIISDPTKLKVLMDYAGKKFVSDDIDFILDVKKFQEGKKLSIPEKTILAKKILNYIAEENVSNEIKVKYGSIKDINIQELEKDNFVDVMNYIVGEFMKGHAHLLPPTLKPQIKPKTATPPTATSSKSSMESNTKSSAISVQKRPYDNTKIATNYEKNLKIFNNIFENSTALRLLQNEAEKKMTDDELKFSLMVKNFENNYDSMKDENKLQMANDILKFIHNTGQPVVINNKQYEPINIPLNDKNGYPSTIQDVKALSKNYFEYILAVITNQFMVNMDDILQDKFEKFMQLK